jgi:hypothetical protein
MATVTALASGSEVSQHVTVADEGHVELTEDIHEEVEQIDIREMSFDEIVEECG